MIWLIIGLIVYAVIGIILGVGYCIVSQSDSGFVKDLFFKIIPIMFIWLIVIILAVIAIVLYKIANAIFSIIE